MKSRMPAVPLVRRCIRFSRVTIPAGLAGWLISVFPSTAHADAPKPAWASVMPAADSPGSDSGVGLSGTAKSRAEALSLYYKASRLERGADDASAYETYQKISALGGTTPRLTDRMAGLLVNMGKFDEALALREKLATEFPEEPGPLLTVASFLNSHARHAPDWKVKALSIVRQAVTRFPESSSAIRYLVRLELEAQNRSGAQEAVEKALRSESTDPGFWLSLATTARNAFPFDDPETRDRHFTIVSGSVEKAISLDSADPGVLVSAADFYARARRTDKALPLYEKTASLRPDDLKARQKLGQCLRLAGREEEAVRIFESLVAIDAGDVVSHEALVSLYETSDPAKALNHRAEVLRLEGGDPRDYAAAARELLKTNLPGEALTLVRRGIFFNPKSASLVQLQAEALDAKGDSSGALDALTEAEILARDKSPKLLDDAFYYTWAGIARKAGKVEEAEIRYRQSIEKTPRKEPARAAAAYHDLGWLWLTQNKNLDAAGELLRTANNLAEDNPAYLDSLGWFHFLKKDHPAALTCLRRAVELSQPEPAAQLLDHLAQAEVAARDRNSGSVSDSGKELESGGK